MAKRCVNLICIVLLISVYLSLSSLPCVAADSIDEIGPYVDDILYKVINQDDQQVLALQNDDVDIIGDMVDPSFLPSLEASENIATANVLRNGYGYVTINTAKYPLNITALRRALAFALDKEAISEDVWDGFSLPQDSVIPAVNPFTVEGQLPYTYYEAKVVLGNQLLDEAGFHSWLKSL